MKEKGRMFRAKGGGGGSRLLKVLGKKLGRTV